MTNYTVEDMMKAYAEDAVELGRKMDKELDYSEDSIKEVDKILEMYHRSLPKGIIGKIFKKSPSEKEKAQVAKIWGGYIGEVIRNNIGGVWSIEENTIILTIEETLIFPPAKAYKRIKNGLEEDVWYYYQALKKDFSLRFQSH